MIRGLGHLSCDDSMREFELLSLLKEEKASERHYSTFQYLEGTYKRAGEGLFTRVCSDRLRGNAFKLKKGRLY